MKIFIKNEIEIKYLAKKLVPFLHPNLYLLLEGPIAAGKTTFVKYLLAIIGVKEIVTSPTFLIIKQYTTVKKITINHMDCYRLLEINKIEKLEEYFDFFLDSINIIEWPKIIKNIIKKKYELIDINIKIINDKERIFTIKTKNIYLKSELKKLNLIC